MDDRDGLKEELGWLKVVVVLAATLEFSLVNWIVNDPAAHVLLRGVAGIVAVAALVIWTVRRVDVILALLKRSSDHADR